MHMACIAHTIHCASCHRFVDMRRWFGTWLEGYYWRDRVKQWRTRNNRSWAYAERPYWNSYVVNLFFYMYLSSISQAPSYIQFQLKDYCQTGSNSVVSISLKGTIQQKIFHVTKFLMYLSEVRGNILQDFDHTGNWSKLGSIGMVKSAAYDLNHIYYPVIQRHD